MGRPSVSRARTGEAGRLEVGVVEPADRAGLPGPEIAVLGR
jgi:hypothetical protein